MKKLLRFLPLIFVMVVGSSEADCIKNQNGEVVCGGGKCLADYLGKVFCTPAGGDAVLDRFGKVKCGPGVCKKDSYSKIWCSKEPGGGAAVDSYGKVTCFGGCVEGSAAFCGEEK